jgi:hypothetical protein
MPQLIQPNSVKVTSKEGELDIHITLDLNINLSGVDLSQATKKSTEEEKKEAVEEKPEWAIPTFTSKDKVKFGKKE